LAVTDANVMTGRLIPDFFPKIFGPEQNEPIDADAVRKAFADMAKEIGDGRTPEQVADGFIHIAVENMANAIKKISVQRGYDVTRYALNCFGGAGGQHACLVADSLGIKTVLIHPLSGLLSAYGMGLADIRATRQQAVEESFGEGAKRVIEELGAKLGGEASAEVEGQGVPRADITVFVRPHIRYAGTDTALEIPAGSLDQMKSAFEAAHKARFGFIDESKELVVEAVAVEAVGGASKFEEPEVAPDANTLPAPARKTRFFINGAWHDANVFLREGLKPGHTVEGPSIVIEPNQTIVVDDGWQAAVNSKNHLVLRRVKVLERTRAIGTEADPVMLEIFNNLFMSIAEQMGVTLQNTAYSVNIKERLDFSCAVFDADGSLVANAPHMPVHLGSMDKSVETVMRENKGKIKPGDVYALNAPYNGGTHLPDITVCTPVFDEAGKEILFWVASRGHHADVGGVTPGSMSPRANTIEEEGVYIDNFKMVDQGRFREKELYALLEGAKFPARNPLQNVNDLKAQIAANEKGVRELQKMIANFGLDVVRAYMGHVQDNAAESVRRVLDRLHDSEFFLRDGPGHGDQSEDHRRQGEARSDRRLHRHERRSRIRTSTPPRPVTRAAVLYVFRVMVDDEIPMNAGCLRPIKIVLPERSMLSPEFPAAVVAGNVETSQAVTNCLFGALKALSAAQGTMNNLTFGNDSISITRRSARARPPVPASTAPMPSTRT
jgi:5-oxoprolinase (ATP-hydrolysing)